MRRIARIATGVLGALMLAGCQSGTSGFGAMELQSAGRAYAHSFAPAPDGAMAERFELRAGDCPASTGDCRADRERVEFFEKKPASSLGVDYWYHYQLFVPADWPRTAPLDTKLAQFHQFGDGKPPVLFELNDDGYVFELSDPSVLQSDPMAPKKPALRITLASQAAMRGHWTDVLVNARWSLGEDGYIKVWVNGIQKVNLSGRNVDRDTPVYFKYGIYRSFVSRYGGRASPTLQVWYRDVRKGKSRESVVGAK